MWYFPIYEHLFVAFHIYYYDVFVWFFSLFFVCSFYCAAFHISFITQNNIKTTLKFSTSFVFGGRRIYTQTRTHIINDNKKKIATCEFQKEINV